jgi:hypothetical protein
MSVCILLLFRDTISLSTSPRAELIEYENSNDSSEVEDDDIDENEGYKALINESVDSTEKIWDAKYKKYLEKGMDLNLPYIVSVYTAFIQMCDKFKYIAITF